MDGATIVNQLYIFVCCLNCFIACAFLTNAIIYRHNCFNFPTLLACNTALIVLVFAADNLAVACYMLIWERQKVLVIDFLCLLRGYIHHSSLVSIHHSLLLQAVQRYCSIKTIKLLDSHTRKILFVLFQWILDFTFLLPILLTGNFTKFFLDNICLISFEKPYVLILVAIVSVVSVDVIMIILYRRLIRYVHQMSAKVHVNRQKQMHRDLKMIRRVILLNFQLLFLSVPVIIVTILAAIRQDLIVKNLFRILLVIVNAAPCSMLIILFWITPNLRKGVLERFTCFQRRSKISATPVIH